MAKTFKAGGTITPCTFVKLDTANDDQVLQAAASTDKVIGISQEGTDAPPLDGASTNAAVAGESLLVHTPWEPPGAETVLLFAGSGGWAAGDLLVSDASGNGVTAPSALGNTSNVWVGAIALTSNTQGLKGEVQPVMFPYRATLS